MSTYTDPGSTATDIEDGNITASITIAGEAAVDQAVTGNYLVIHSVTDSGSKTTNVTRTVNVVANNAPSIVLTGANPIQLVQGTAYVEPGHSATDDHDGDVTAAVVVSGTVDHTTVGTYTISYVVTDAQGLSTTVNRTVNVILNNAPVITLAGANPQTVIQGS